MWLITLAVMGNYRFTSVFFVVFCYFFNFLEVDVPALLTYVWQMYIHCIFKDKNIESTWCDERLTSLIFTLFTDSVSTKSAETCLWGSCSVKHSVVWIVLLQTAFCHLLYSTQVTLQTLAWSFQQGSTFTNVDESIPLSQISQEVWCYVSLSPSRFAVQQNLKNILQIMTKPQTGH